MTTKPQLDAQRYRQIRDAAGQVLVEHCDGRMPIRPQDILAHMPMCRCDGFSGYKQRMGFPRHTAVEEVFATRDAITSYDVAAGHYLVIYNDDDRARNVPGRLRWTLAHEIGHITLGHLLVMGQSLYLQEDTGEEYARFEREADYFAAMLLAHPALLHACAIPTVSALQTFCGLSQAAATSRFVALRRAIPAASLTDGLVLKHFEQVIRERNLPFVTEPDFSVYER